MRTVLIATAVVLAVHGQLFAIQEATSPAEPPTIEIGTRREIFVDDFLIEQLSDARLKMHPPQLAEGVLAFDQPWEGAFSGYATFLKDGDVYRMYYRGMPVAGGDTSDAEVTCCAVSLDGIQWHKPQLGIFDRGGNRENNIVLQGETPASHNFAPFLDTCPTALADQRFKALGGSAAGLIPFASPDGIHWTRLSETPVVTGGAFDSQNVAFWSDAEQCYCCYFRTFARDGTGRYRSISRATSPDFLHWSEPQAMTFGDTPLEHLYTNQTIPYFRAPHLYLALAARFLPGKRVLTADQAAAIQVNTGYSSDCSDTVLMSTRGGHQYQRTFMESYLRPGPGPQHWVSRSNYVAHGIVPTGPGELSIYMSRNYGQPTAYLQRYTLRTDGFASVNAGYGGGEMITRPFRFPPLTEAERAPRQAVQQLEIAERNRTRSPRVVHDDAALQGTGSLAITQPLTFALPGTSRLGERFTLAAAVAHVPPGHRRLFSSYNGGPPEDNELIFDFNANGNVAGEASIRLIVGRFQLTVPAAEVGNWSRRPEATHLAVTWDRGLCRIYVNGTEVAEGLAEGAPPSLELASDLHVGEDLPPTSTVNEPFLGTLDDVLVWREALPAESIRQMAIEGCDPFAARLISETPVDATGTPRGVLLNFDTDRLDQGYGAEPVKQTFSAVGGTLVDLPTLPAVPLKRRELEINYATSAAGSIAVEVLDLDGNPIPGFSAAECDLRAGDEIERIVSWRGGETDLGDLADQPIRLRFLLKDADLYAIRIR